MPGHPTINPMAQPADHRPPHHRNQHPPHRKRPRQQHHPIIPPAQLLLRRQYKHLLPCRRRVHPRISAHQIHSCRIHQHRPTPAQHPLSRLGAGPAKPAMTIKENDVWFVLHAGCSLSTDDQFAPRTPRLPPLPVLRGRVGVGVRAMQASCPTVLPAIKSRLTWNTQSIPLSPHHPLHPLHCRTCSAGPPRSASPTS